MKQINVIPFGTHTIHIVRFDPDGVSSREGNEHVPVWNHDIQLIEKDETHTQYTDRVEIHAGWNTDMHIWYGIKGTVDKKLSANLEELKAKGYPFTCKLFEDMGHGGLIGENTERFIEEVDAVHLQSKKTEKRV